MIEKCIENIVKKLVEKPDRVMINEVESDGKIIVRVLVAPQDLSRVIGSGGRVFRALRTLVSVFSSSDFQRDLVVDSVKE